MTTPPLDTLKFDAAGLIPAIVRDHANGEVLMMAWMNRASLETTIATRFTHFWSRSRERFWKKGESSGHTQRVLAIRTDCDRDALLIDVEQVGAACHDGYRSCFYNDYDLDDGGWTTVGEPLVDPRKVYGKAE